MPEYYFAPYKRGQCPNVHLQCSSSSVTTRPSDRLDYAHFRTRLLAWYHANARDLPWRKDRDPYRVWVSEIMLQQTRVAAVIEHYHEFLRRFPTVEKLARARESSVLAAWSGLGYYRRARMLHAASKVVVREFDGNFPRAADAWRELPGIGRYTAAAIASIAFGEAVAVVDGNVERVVQRFVGERLTDESQWDLAGKLLDDTRPRDFNQAMMELGATVCTPRIPMCLTCPLVDLCGTRGELPASTEKQRQQKKEIHYALHTRTNHAGEEAFVVQRPRDSALMPGMWELPEVQLPRTRTKPVLTLRHAITVTDYSVKIWKMPALDNTSGKWIPIGPAPKIALTGLARKIIRKLAVMPAISG